jgi:hypothetical protein
MGREQFIQPLLRSFEAIIQDDNFKILVILNGVSGPIEDIYLEWEKHYPNQVEVVVKKENDAGIAAFLPIIKNVKSEWICFPSDDDLLDVSFFSKWGDLSRGKAEFGVIASGINLIDSEGNSLGINKTPFYDQALSFPENVARSLSECPFLWPGLIIRVNLIPSRGPSSRYVSDWWLGLHLMFNAKVCTLEDFFTHYRVHGGQESNVSSSSRKNFEALIHLGDFISSQSFRTWIDSLELTEMRDFLGFLLKYPPLYSDPNFSSEFISIVTNAIRSTRSEESIKHLATFVSAYSHGVLVGSSDLRYLGNSLALVNEKPTTFNFNFLIDDGSCTKIKSIPNYFNEVFAQVPVLNFGCSHSRKQRNLLRLDCENLASQRQILDSLSQLGTEEFNRLGFFDHSVSRFEYVIIKKFRRMKYFFSLAITQVIYRAFKR